MRLRHLLGLAALFSGIAAAGPVQAPGPANQLKPRIIVQAVRGGRRDTFGERRRDAIIAGAAGRPAGTAG